MTSFVKQTDILTSEGWKPISSLLNKTFEVLTANPVNRELNYTEGKVSERYKNPSSILGLKSENMNLCLLFSTPVLASRRKDSGEMDTRIILASEIKKSYKLPLTGFSFKSSLTPSDFILPSCEQLEQYTRKPIVVPEKAIPLKDWLIFFGFWVADGCVFEGFNTYGNRKYSVSIKQNTSNEAFVLECFKNIGFEAKIYNGGSASTRNYNVYSKQLWTYLRQFGVSSERFIPRWIMNLPKEYLLYFWKGYIFGNRCNNKVGQTQLTTTSHQLADDLQELVLKIFGRVVQVGKQHKKYSYKEGTCIVYVINVSLDKNLDNYAKYRNPSISEYNDYLYEIEVSEKVCMLIRQNGKIMFVGV